MSRSLPSVSIPVIRLLLPVFVAGSLATTAFEPAVGASTWGGVPVVEPIMPPDSRGNNQTAFNNLAWQQFITLNWLADPANPGEPDPNASPADFGAPTDSRPVVWESFKEASEVFRPGAEPPTPWGSARTLPTAFLSLKGSHQLKATSSLGIKGLFAASKFSGGPQLDLSEYTEAFTNGAWLTAQPMMNNYMTLFEKRLNEDEFNYINDNQLYDATIQNQFAVMPGINLPDGSQAFASYGTVGAIEIKAGWIQLDDPTLWPQFKISQAYVSYPTDGGAPTPPKLVTVGLVALHIIRKTPNAQQFAWSTFEHVNNAPSVTDIQKKTLKAWYTYFDLNCDPSTSYYKCQQNKQPVPGTDPYNAPIQVVRTTPISTTSTNNIALLNSNTWNTITAANPKSVFLNYQLVNVLWPNANTSIPAGATIPLTNGNAQPPEAQQPVANSVLETYHQDINCLSCHTYAPVASATSAKRVLKIMRSGMAVKKVSAEAATLASDYSFLFSEAKTKTAAQKSPEQE